MKANLKRKKRKLSQPSSAAARLAALRGVLRARRLDGFLVPHTDEYQNEYLPACAERLAWLAGFTGSAGFAVVLAKKAAFFTDGRYTIQAAREVSARHFTLFNSAQTTPSRWLGENAPRGSVIGFDPWLHSASEIAALEKTLAVCGIRLKPFSRNPLDGLWGDRPAAPSAPVFPHALSFAGESAAAKRKRLGAELKKSGLKAAVLGSPDSVAWLLNIRGGDITHTPLPLCRAILRDDGRVLLFVERAKISPALKKHLGPAVSRHDPAALAPALRRFKGQSVRLDPVKTPLFIAQTLQKAGAKIRDGVDPCELPKACKNTVELAGIRAAHRRDGAALVRFLSWLSREGLGAGLDESQAAQKLESLRRQNTHFHSLSFPTISAAGANGAIVHYRVPERGARPLKPGEIYLLDSGAQYFDGTTDVTRTIFLGDLARAPSDEQKDRFTRVLKGHIALAMARFPRGTCGPQLDVLARRFLWEIGADYDHGTGHGVGAFLGVHEGPQRIAKIPNRVALQPGMVISNEPGYYKAGEYGIRIENLVCVREEKAARNLLGFETLTLVPIDLRLVESALLRREEIIWLNEYHARVREALAPLLGREDAAWLAQATAAL